MTLLCSFEKLNQTKLKNKMCAWSTLSVPHSILSPLLPSLLLLPVFTFSGRPSSQKLLLGLMGPGLRFDSGKPLRALFLWMLLPILRPQPSPDPVLLFLHPPRSQSHTHTRTHAHTHTRTHTHAQTHKYTLLTSVLSDLSVSQILLVIPPNLL